MDKNEALSQQLKKKYHALYVTSKYAPKFPQSTERDYQRFANAFLTDIYGAVLKESMPELLRVLKDIDAATVQRMDAKGSRAKENEKKRSLQRWRDVDNTVIRLRRVINTIRQKLNAAIGLYQTGRKLNSIASATRKLTVKEWKKAIGKTLGVNILEDYFDGTFYTDILEKWVKENVDLIVTIPHDALDEMEKIVIQSYLDGKPITTITKEIQRNYSMTKSHARLIARDQMGKLNSKITQHQQKSCGVNRYKWSDSGDSRVRKDHKRLNGKIFSWNDPPVIDTRTGRRGHPGDDYQCRCVAIPVFDFDTLDVPVDITKNEVKGR